MRTNPTATVRHVSDDEPPTGAEASTPSPLPGDPDVTARLLRKRLADAPVELPVSGKSMGSTIRSGSTVLIAELSEPRRGEVWAFVGVGSGIVVHRVRHLTRDTMTGRGDGNLVDDIEVPRAHLIGRVAAATGPDGSTRRFGLLDRRSAAIRLFVRGFGRRVVDKTAGRSRSRRRRQSRPPS